MAEASNNLLTKLERVALIGTRGLSIVGLVALLILAMMTLTNGLMRWAFNQPLSGVVDVGSLAIALAVSCCLPVGLMERSHITFRLIDGISKPVGQVFNAIAAVIVWVVMVLMAWQFFLYGKSLAEVHETTYVLKWPTAPFWFGVDVILWMSVVVQGIVVALEIGRLFGHRPLVDHPTGH